MEAVLVIRDPRVLRAAIAAAHVEQLHAEGLETRDPERLEALAREAEVTVEGLGRICEEVGCGR
jgi:hypothetical protein